MQVNFDQNHQDMNLNMGISALTLSKLETGNVMKHAELFY